jgi:hypothetical protein
MKMKDPSVCDFRHLVRHSHGGNGKTENTLSVLLSFDPEFLSVNLRIFLLFCEGLCLEPTMVH